MKAFKEAIYLLALLLFVACNAGSQQKEKSLSELRNETDTVLAFQGIRISEPLDSACYYELINNLPVKLYRKDLSEFVFSDILINSEFLSLPGEIVHSLSLHGQIDKFFDFLSFVCLYEENYGCFSYYERFDQEGKRMGSVPVGKKSQLSGKPWTRQDAISDFINYGESDSYSFFFTWEWKNQYITIVYNHNNTPNTIVFYSDEGLTQRKQMEEEKAEQTFNDAWEKEEKRKRQQI